VDVARHGLTPRQSAAVARKTGAERDRLAALFKGERHDKYLRDRVADDKFLNGRVTAGPRRLPKGHVSPDFLRVNPRGASPSWYDLTTQKAWAAHQKKYTSFGDGKRIWRFW